MTILYYKSGKPSAGMLHNYFCFLDGYLQQLLSEFDEFSFISYKNNGNRVYSISNNETDKKLHLIFEDYDLRSTYSGFSFSGFISLSEMCEQAIQQYFEVEL